MPCYHPILAWKCADGGIAFVERSKYDIVKEIQLPCGQCVGCRLERARQWAMRCVHEASLYEQNSFITLTYDDAHIPAKGQLEYRDFQLFMKKLRKENEQPIRFYMCGEYGPQLQRPHFHACLFNKDFQDKTAWGISPGGAQLYRSAELEQVWDKGFSSVGDLTYQSAAYTARYVMKKMTGPNSKEYYNGLTPEFTRMSLKPGIGRKFLEKWKSDIYPRDYVVVNSKEMKPPKYYDKVYEKEDKEKYEELKEIREKKARDNYEDNTERRLEDKEIVTTARLKFKKRELE